MQQKEETNAKQEEIVKAIPKVSYFKLYRKVILMKKSERTIKEKLIRSLCYIIFTGFSAFSSSAYSQSGLAEAYCQSHIPIVYQAIELRNQSIPIDIAYSAADSAFGINRSLGIWLRDAIKTAYSHPDEALKLLDNGAALRSCTSYVRGY